MMGCIEVADGSGNVGSSASGRFGKIGVEGY